MIRQFNPWGCGLYAVANACNMPEFITEERLEKSKQGTVIGQLSKWLQEDGKPFCVDVLFYDHAGTKLPDTALGYFPIGDDVTYLPILLNVRFSDEGLNHLVGGKVAKDGTLYLYDSLKPDVVETTLKEVNEMYHHVYGLFIFMGYETGKYCFI